LSFMREALTSTNLSLHFGLLRARLKRVGG
jgi:hypothetical protein